ncbi:hypothetical protein QFC21_002673 [Naganishia friedmannii]|uniref:Uncharacterized protein n=1 Tax=Naganishia friedmannii TaxID=89922 RepID=A0ACC2VVW8_9TREE|nr:hypothetical protein QFC21_002673 [Naganishia friedmannii]
MAAAPFAIKRALRKVTQQRINVLPVEEIERQSQLVLNQLRESGVLDGARAVGCYLSMQKGELSTDGIVRYLLGRGDFCVFFLVQRVRSHVKLPGTPLYVPIIPSPPTSSTSSAPPYAPPAPSHDMRMLRLYSTQDWESLKRDKWGIPDAGTERKDLEGCIPREDYLQLGHGKGYYDRYIKRYRAYASARGEKPPLLEQEQLRAKAAKLQQVPVTEDDERMDWIVTAEGVRKS